MLNFRSLSLTTTDNKLNNVYSSVTDTRVLRLAEEECSLLVCESLLTINKGRIQKMLTIERTMNQLVGL